MFKKECFPDNAPCEGFFRRTENEFFCNRDRQNITIEELTQDLNEYLHWYNEKKIKKSLGYLSLVDYRRTLGLVV
jgi:putative transposase